MKEDILFHSLRRVELDRLHINRIEKVEQTRSRTSPAKNLQEGDVNKTGILHREKIWFDPSAESYVIWPWDCIIIYNRFTYISECLTRRVVFRLSLFTSSAEFLRVWYLPNRVLQHLTMIQPLKMWCNYSR